MATRTWKHEAQSSDWNDEHNWESGAPQDGDDVVIPQADDETSIPTASNARVGNLQIHGALQGALSVTKALSWDSGAVSAQISIEALVSGTIQLGDPSLMLFNGGCINNAGDLQLVGPGSLQMGDGATIDNSGTFTVTGSVQISQTGGSPPGFINQGTLSFPGVDSPVNPNVIFTDGSCFLRLVSGTADIGGAVQFQSASHLDLAGGKLSGNGRIVVIDDAMLTTWNPTDIPQDLTLVVAGGTVDGGDIGQLAVRLRVLGSVVIRSGSLPGRVHVAGEGSVSWPANNTSYISGVLVIENHVDVADKSEIIMSSGGEIIVGGTLRFIADATVSSGTLTNVGHVALTQASGKATFDGCTLYTTDTAQPRPAAASPWPFPRASIKRGSLSVTQGRLTQTDGSPYIRSTSGTTYVRQHAASEPDQSWSLAGLTIEHDAVLVAGNLPAGMDCDGRIEVDITGMQTPILYLTNTARLEFPEVWGSAAVSLKVDTMLTAGGTIALPNSAALPSTATPVLAPNLNGRFARLDHVGNDAITIDYTAAGLTAKATSLGSAQGMDTMVWPSNIASADGTQLPAGTADERAHWLMQQLYECTEWSYVGVYLGPIPPYKSLAESTWMGKMEILQDQGWGVLAIAFGWGSKVPKNIADWAKVTAHQAEQDADLAVTRAQATSLSPGVVIFFDLESDMVNAPGKRDVYRAYLTAWFDQVTAKGYIPGLYCPAAEAAYWAQARPDVMLFPVGLGGAHGAPDNTLDPDGHPAVVDITDFSPSGINPLAWQWAIDQRGVLFLDGTGTLRDIGEQVAGTPNYPFDFSTALSVYPSLPPLGVAKSYVKAISMTATVAGWTSGTPNQVTVRLSRPAPGPGGSIVLLSATNGAIQPPAQTVVPAGAEQVVVDVDVHPVTDNTAVDLLAWTPRQLRDNAATLSLTVGT